MPMKKKYSAALKKQIGSISITNFTKWNTWILLVRGIFVRVRRSHRILIQSGDEDQTKELSAWTPVHWRQSYPFRIKYLLRFQHVKRREIGEDLPILCHRGDSISKRSSLVFSVSPLRRSGSPLSVPQTFFPVFLLMSTLPGHSPTRLHFVYAWVRFLLFNWLEG